MKRFLAFVFIIFLLFYLTTCEKKEKLAADIFPKSVVLGFSQLGAESDWRTANSESIKAAAKEAGIQLMFSNGQQSQENQIKAIRSFIANQVDVIAFAPLVESGWDTVLKEAKEAGIPVIITDRAIKTEDENLYVTLIGSDFKEEGKRAGRWLLEKMKDKKGKINIIELQGTIGSTPAIQRKEGFEEVIRSNPNMEINLSVSADFMRSKGYEEMELLLKQDMGKIDVLYSHNDDMALGAINAMEEAGLRPGVDIIIISIDANRGAFEKMIEGKMNCTVECNPLLGPQLMQVVEDLVMGKQIPKRIFVEESVFPEEIAEEEIENRKY
jgi:simple sugar transport system substrate-binding protein